MKDTIVFDNVHLTDVLKDIHNNALSKRAVINGVIEQMTKLITNPQEAMMLAPIIREFIDVGVKSDEQLVKVATIVQRMVSAESAGSDSDVEFMSEEERERLIANAMADDKIVQTELDAAMTHKPK